jgi:hypothetical protein
MRLLRLLPGILLLAGCSPAGPRVEQPTREAIWAELQVHAVRYRLDPEFLYALVAAESNFRAGARNGDARGLYQIKPGAWRTVSTDPYEPGVWQWRANLRVGVEYLAWCRQTLHRRGRFSYPALLACFHYGLDHMEERDFDPRRVAVPSSRIYRELWSGNLRPVAPPGPTR